MSSCFKGRGTLLQPRVFSTCFYFLLLVHPQFLFCFLLFAVLQKVVLPVFSLIGVASGSCCQFVPVAVSISVFWSLCSVGFRDNSLSLLKCVRVNSYCGGTARGRDIKYWLLVFIECLPVLRESWLLTKEEGHQWKRRSSLDIPPVPLIVSCTSVWCLRMNFYLEPFPSYRNGWVTCILLCCMLQRRKWKYVYCFSHLFWIY